MEKPKIYWKERPSIFNVTGTKSETFEWTFPARKTPTGIDPSERARRRKANRAARQARKVNRH